MRYEFRRSDLVQPAVWLRKPECHILFVEGARELCSNLLDRRANGRVRPIDWKELWRFCSTTRFGDLDWKMGCQVSCLIAAARPGERGHREVLEQ